MTAEVVETTAGATGIQETVATVEMTETEAQRGTTTVSLSVDDEIRDETEVTVPAGERSDVTFTATLNETGEYAVTVDEMAAGDLSVAATDTPADTDAPPDTDDDTAHEEQTTGFGVGVGVIALLTVGVLAQRR